MIVDRDTVPEQKLYFIGALIIDLLRQVNDSVDLLSLYESYLKKHGDIVITKFLLVMDWLFIIGVVESKNGEIKACF